MWFNYILNKVYIVIVTGRLYCGHMNASPLNTLTADESFSGTIEIKVAIWLIIGFFLEQRQMDYSKMYYMDY